MFRANVYPVFAEVKGEHEQLQTRSHAALRNMLEYCQARVVQLTDQYCYLDFQSRGQYDLFQLLETARRLQRVRRNARCFSEKCVLIKVELARRERFCR